MYRIPGVLSAATTPAPAVPRVRPTPSSPPAPEDGSAAGLAKTIPGQAEDEQIAVGLNDNVVRRLIAAGLELQSALELLGDHPASVKIRHAIDELDQAIQDATVRARDTA